MHSELETMFDLKGRVAMVTGGARTLGYDGACVLAAAGADLIITSRKLDQAKSTAETICKNYGVDVLPLALDQTLFDQVQTAASQAIAWKGQVDVLLNNAGGGTGNSPAILFERDPHDIEKMIHLNLTGALWCCREVGRHMAKRHSGKIINIASIAGLLGRDRKMYERNQMLGQPVDYAGAKAGVIGMTKDLAALKAPQGLYVNVISPGGFERDLSDGFVKDFSERTALGRMGRDGIDLKGAILFLASAASDYVVGQNLVVDGGFEIWH